MSRAQDAEFKARMRLFLDFNRIRTERLGPGRGLKGVEAEGIAPRVATVQNDLAFQRSRGELALLDLPFRKEPAAAAAGLAERLRERFDTLAVLGAGEAALGARMLVDALAPPFQELLPKERRGGMRILFDDGDDPDRFAALLELLDTQTTAFAVLSKSDTTPGTLARFWTLRGRLRTAFGEDGLRERLVVVTDPEKGSLRQLAREDGLNTLDIPPPVCGRFAALSPTGLLPALAAGIDVEELLAGAAAVDLRCREADMWKNPAAALAGVAYLMDTLQHRPVLVVWPFAGALRTFSAWFVQLWGGSLYQRVVVGGAMPMSAVEEAGRQALGQLLPEGADDKFVVFVRVRSFSREVSLPSLQDHADLEDLSYLGGKHFSELTNAAYLSTAIALADAGRPSCSVDLPALNPFTLGGLIQLSQHACLLAAGLYGVNPFDQPRMEARLNLQLGLLGRPGFHGLAARAAGEDPGEDRYRI